MQVCDNMGKINEICSSDRYRRYEYKSGLDCEELNIVSREQFSTDNKEPEITLNKISDIVKAFDKDITGIGMSCPGPLDLINGKVLTPPNLNGKWHNLEISKVLSEKTGKPVYLDNDANLAGLAEAVVGEGKDCKIMQ